MHVTSEGDLDVIMDLSEEVKMLRNAIPENSTNLNTLKCLTSVEPNQICLQLQGYC
jgi:hypothetical protein